jgi:glycosyltransferase involved in cell wall biosynthesis
MPKSLLEPAACGRPLVTTDTPGCRDLVPDGSTGVLVPLYDAEALADAIQKLAENPEMRRRMGDNARALVAREFSEERVIADTQALYRDLAARAAGQRQG